MVANANVRGAELSCDREACWGEIEVDQLEEGMWKAPELPGGGIRGGGGVGQGALPCGLGTQNPLR